jgi:hypothetical protein
MSILCRGRWLAVAFILLCAPAAASAESVTLAWDPSEGASGYTVRWGTALGSYPSSATAGSGTSFAISGLIGGGTYWAVVQAYNSAGTSEYSTPLQFTVPATTVACTYSISPASTNMTAAGGSGTISVTTQTGCAWSATTSSGFITFQNGTGRTGSGSVGFTVAANTTTSSRSVIASVAGSTFTVSQAGAICTYSISPATVSIAAAGGSGTVTVTTQTGCAWSATSSSAFLTFQNGTGRTGPGSVGFTVAANTTSSSRTGTGSVAGKAFKVSQAAASASCSYSISPASASIPAAGGSGSISITTQTGCAWSATSTSGFITFQNGTGRSGSGSVAFTVPANTTGFRTGTATVAGKTFTVSQASAATTCTYSISPASSSMPVAGGSGTISVTTQTGCAWSAIPTSTFIAFQNGTGRTGSGSVGFTVAANTGAFRTGTATVAGKTFVVSQVGGGGGTSWSSDFDGDGKNDLLVHDSVAGTVEAWFLDGVSIKGTQSLSDAKDPNWMLVGHGDFNDDSKPDVVWQHRTEGWIEIWYMDGTNRIGSTSPSISQIADPLWQIVGVGDFNRDGKPDLAWQHTGDGALAVWQMNGATVTDTLSVVPDRVTDLLWKVVGVGDFNNDGTSDLLWRHHGTGEMGAWLMNGLSRIIHAPLSPIFVPDQGWKVGGVADVNGDGKTDLVWQHTNGSILIWYMNGTSRASTGTVPTIVPLGWQIVGPK